MVNPPSQSKPGATTIAIRTAGGAAIIAGVPKAKDFAIPVEDTPDGVQMADIGIAAITAITALALTTVSGGRAIPAAGASDQTFLARRI